MKIFIIVMLFICTASPALAADNDWAYELSSEAKQIYAKKLIQYPCKNIPALLKQDNAEELYYTIRDAGLFQTKSCDSFIRRNINALNELPGVKDAIVFYYYKLGDKRQLNVLATYFDNKISADDWTVELLGYLDDWDVSGVRLVRLAAHADLVGAELLCSAITWRRYLYGERNFKEHWYKYGEKEKIDRRRLDQFYEMCRVEP